MANHMRGCDLEALNRAIQGIYAHTGLGRFPAMLLASVSPLIPSEVACYTELEPAQGRVRNAADRPDPRLDALLPVLAELQHQHPRIVDFQEHGEERARKVSDYVTRAVWHRTDLFQHFYGALDIEDQLGTLLPAGEGIILALVFNRRARSFKERHRVLLDLLRPHVQQAFANATAVSKLEARAGDGARIEASDHGLVRIFPDGAVGYVTERARALLDRYFPVEGRRRWGLPDQVVDWIRGQDACDTGAGGREIERRRSRAGASGRLQMTLLADVATRGWTLLLEEPPGQGAVDGPPMFASVALRYRRVLERLLTGQSEKEVASCLGLSRHTVHEYVKRIYKQLGVSSRAELMALWVRDR